MQKFPTSTMVSISCPTFARQAPEVCMVPYGLVAQVPCSRCVSGFAGFAGCKLHGTSWDLRWKRYQDDSRWLKMTQNSTQNSTQIRLGVSFFLPESIWAKGSSNSGGLSNMFTSSHLHITSSHFHILTSSHPHIFTSSHLHITSSHLLIFSSSHFHILTSSHFHIFSSSHLLIFTSSHPHILTSSHLHIFTFSLALLLSCPLALLPSSFSFFLFLS